MMGRDEIVAALVLLGWYLRRDSADKMLGVFNDSTKTLYWLGFDEPYRVELPPMVYTTVRNRSCIARWDEATSRRLSALWCAMRGNDGT